MASQQEMDINQIGVVIVTHVDYGSALLRAAEFILGPLQDCVSIAVDPTFEVEDTVGRLQEAVDLLDKGCGILILTDMFGGTPTNLSLSLLGNGKGIEVLTGVNLPMLLKVLGNREHKTLDELTQLAVEAGCEGIIAASTVLQAKNNP